MGCNATPTRDSGLIDNRINLQEKDDYPDAKKPVAGASGKLTVLTGAQKTETTLAAATGNALVAADKVQVSRGSKAVAVIKFADGKSVTARFSVK